MQKQVLVALVISLCTFAVSGSVADAQIGEDTAPKGSQNDRCRWRLSDYENGERAEGFVLSKPCAEKHYRYVMNNCSESFKTRAEAAHARCTGSPAAKSAPPTPTTLSREVDCNQRFPGETGLGLYLKGKFRATCTVERSYHDRDDAKKKITIRVTVCARSDSQIEVPPLARMRARDYAFSLALKSLPHPEMDSGGDKDIGCGN